MKSSELASRIRVAMATKQNEGQNAPQALAAGEAVKQREIAEDKEVERILGELLVRLNSSGNIVGQKVRVMVIDYDVPILSFPRSSVIADRVFQQLSEAEVESGWYPVRDKAMIEFGKTERTVVVSVKRERNVIDLVYGKRP